MATDKFLWRHIGPRPEDIEEMLKVVGVQSLDELIEQTVPASIRLKEPLDLPAPLTESEFFARMKKVASKNKLYRSFIGQGYYDTILPAVIQRNVLENPAWYTSYTPYQAEVSQGRLEALLNFQTMVVELTGMEIANCSLLDEATAAAEAATMMLALRSRTQQKAGANTLFVDREIFPQNLAVIRTRAIPQGIEVKVGVLEKECRHLIRRFVTFNTERRPYVTLKWAESADGFIDIVREGGNPVVLSTPVTSVYVHKQRAENMAILVGRCTALLDNPSLTVRNWYGRNPLRLVIDRRLTLPAALRLFDRTVPTLVFTECERLSETNLTYVKTDFSQDILPQILQELYDRKIQTLLVEGGSRLLQSFIDDGLWDEIYIEQARTELGTGVEAPHVPSGHAADFFLRDNVVMRHYVRSDNQVRP